MNERFADDPDARLMLRFQDGDAEAFGALIERHSAALLQFMARYMGSMDAATDLASEVVFRALKAAPGWSPSAAFRTWLFTIAVNVCLNAKRRDRNHPRVSLDVSAAAEFTAARGETPEEEVQREERARIVRRAIQALPATQRAAVIMARYHEMPYTDIAAALKLSVPAVKSLMNRAAENLRSSLRRQLDDFQEARPPKQRSRSD